MSAEANKAVVRHMVEEVYNKANIELAGKYFDKGCVLHHPALPGPMEGLEMVMGFMGGIFVAFPDFRADVQDMIAEGDKLVVRSIISGTFEGPFAGIPPTGLHTTWSATGIYRMVEGKICEIWEDVDMLGSFQRLGVLPKLS
jgi:predicted ester cyclase